MAESRLRMHMESQIALGILPGDLDGGPGMLLSKGYMLLRLSLSTTSVRTQGMSVYPRARGRDVISFQPCCSLCVQLAELNPRQTRLTVPAVGLDAGAALSTQKLHPVPLALAVLRTRMTTLQCGGFEIRPGNGDSLSILLRWDYLLTLRLRDDEYATMCSSLYERQRPAGIDNQGKNHRSCRLLRRPYSISDMLSTIASQRNSLRDGMATSALDSDPLRPLA